MNVIIGVDFDNTIVRYDALFHGLAMERHLIPPSLPISKKSVRDHLRTLSGGEIEWQKLQARAYGPAMNQASLFPGVLDFFRRCRQDDTDVYIVSHKTRTARYDPAGTDLRQAALRFLEQHGFFDPLQVPRQNVFFESTRENKNARIADLACDVFIDDLCEVFLEPSFPDGTTKILFTPNGETEHAGSDVALGSWDQIQAYLFEHE